MEASSFRPRNEHDNDRTNTNDHPHTRGRMMRHPAHCYDPPVERRESNPPPQQQQLLACRRRRRRESRSWSPHHHNEDVAKESLMLGGGVGGGVATRRRRSKHDDESEGRRHSSRRNKRQRRRERSFSAPPQNHHNDDFSERRRRRRRSYSSSTTSVSSPPPRRRERYSERCWSAQPPSQQQHEQHALGHYYHHHRHHHHERPDVRFAEYEPMPSYYQHHPPQDYQRYDDSRRRGERQRSWEESDSRDRRWSDRRRHPHQQQHQRRRHSSSPRRSSPRRRRLEDHPPPPEHRHYQPPAPVVLQQQQQQQHPRAGVVSMEDEISPATLSSQQQHQQHVAVTAAASSTTPTDPNKNHNKRPSSDEDDESRDDTVGHFKGGPGTVIAGRYKIIQDLGIGTFGRVVECLDLRRRGNNNNNNNNNNYPIAPHAPHQRAGALPPQPPFDVQEQRRDRVAIKIVRNVKKKKYYESALIEAGIVEEVNRRGGRGTSHCAILWEAFTFDGHFCMVFESLGLSLYDFLKRHNYQPFPMVCIRDFAQQLLEALEFLHGFQLIHTDLKPENILLTHVREVTYRGYRVPESTRIKVIDFGGATYDYERKSSVINTRQYRSPEVILGVGWSMPSDLWSAGCILAELYSGELLFATHDNQEHLALMERIIGPFPRWMITRAKNTRLAHESFSSSTGRHRGPEVLSTESALYVKKMVPLDGMIRKQDAQFLQLLRRILVIDPNERWTARESLRYRL